MIVMVTGSVVRYPFDCAAKRPHCFFRTSGEINEFMKMHVINLAKRVLRQIGKRNYRVKVTIMGFVRESSTINIIQEHAKIRAKVPVYDSFVQSLSTKAGVFASAGSVDEALSCAVCAIFPVDHNVFRGISTRWWRS